MAQYQRFRKKNDPDRKNDGSQKIKSRCHVSEHCGGCTMIDTDYEEQIRIKQQTVQDAIGRYGSVEPMIRMKNPGRYRNKVTSIFALDRKGKPVCGVYRSRSHEVVPVFDCLIENRRADAVVKTIYDMLRSFKIRVYDEDSGLGLLRAVQIRTAHATGQMMVTLVTSSPVFPSTRNFCRALLAAHPEITTIVQNINDRQTTMILGNREKILYGPGYIEDRLCGRVFRIASRSFYQVNSLQTEKLYHIAVDMAGLSGRETVLDAYCGIGTIGIIASDHCAHVLSVELNDASCEMAVHNAAANGASNVEVIQDDAGRFMAEMAQNDERADVVFMDPPRSGASEEFLKSLISMAPRRIVYVSCNPETLARDLAFLTQNGFQMKKAVPVDMFPYTDNIETAALLCSTNS